MLPRLPAPNTVSPACTPVSQSWENTLISGLFRTCSAPFTGHRRALCDQLLPEFDLTACIWVSGVLYQIVLFPAIYVITSSFLFFSPYTRIYVWQGRPRVNVLGCTSVSGGEQKCPAASHRCVGTYQPMSNCISSHLLKAQQLRDAG